ncbi:hypothetical protein [Thalassomonas sp. RHCl1]|nr:hypothetical protein [Thalassomonas sp. RHCl1]
MQEKGRQRYAKAKQDLPLDDTANFKGVGGQDERTLTTKILYCQMLKYAV